jgi:hypothetical protein
MPLPPELHKIKESLEKRQKTKALSEEERVLLGELSEIDKHVSKSTLNEIRSGVTKMTGPGGDVCGCCGRPR